MRCWFVSRSAAKLNGREQKRKQCVVVTWQNALKRGFIFYYIPPCPWILAFCWACRSHEIDSIGQLDEWMRTAGSKLKKMEMNHVIFVSIFDIVESIGTPMELAFSLCLVCVAVKHDPAGMSERSIFVPSATIVTRSI